MIEEMFENFSDETYHDDNDTDQCLVIALFFGDD